MDKKQRTLFYIASLAILFGIVSFVLVGFIIADAMAGDWYIHLAFGVVSLALGALIIKE